MSKENRIVLEEFFETGDRPTQSQFAKLIRSAIIQKEDDVWIDPNNNVGIGKEFPDERLHVNGNVKVEGNISGNQAGSAFTISNLANFLGPYIELYGKNTSGRGGELTFVAAEGDSQGFNFMQYEDDNGTHRWRPRLRIVGSGEVGIGIMNPQAKLHVDGNVRLEGDIAANKGSDRFWIGNMNGATLELHGNAKSDGREGEMTLIAGNGTKGGFRFLQHQGTGQWNHLVSIDKKGQVGVNTQSPNNLLEINETAGNDTGLRLPSGASQGFVLTAKDNAGNVHWQPKSALNDGDWTFNGNHLYNGNSGNVGVGTTNPQEKLHVQGNLQVTGGDILGDKSSGGFLIGNHGPYLRLNSNNIGGRMSLVAGDGAEGGFTFFQKDNSSGQMQWIPQLRIAKNGTLVLGDNSIRFRGENDSNHGLGWFGTGKQFASKNIDGPVLYGNSGGGLGSSTGGSEKLALRWDQNQNVDFQGKIKTNGKPLFGTTMFHLPNGYTVKTFLAADLPNWETFYDPNEYYGFVATFQFDFNQSKWGDSANNTTKGKFALSIQANSSNTGWEITAALPNDANNHTGKYIRAIFIHKSAM